MLDLSSLTLHMPASLTDTFRLLDLCGVLLNGILGGLIARRKNFDLVGFVVLAMLTATAGGILRDVMIQAGPPFALTDPYYLYTACLGATVAWFVPLTSRPTRRLLVVADAVILGCWAGLNIMWTGFTLIRDSVGGLMDIAPSAEVLRTVEEVLARHRQVGMIDFHAVRVREAGNRRFMELHVLVPAAWSVKKGHDFTEQVIDELIEADTSLRISAHLEPIEDPKSYEDLEDI